MGKKAILVILISISIFMTGCGNHNAKQPQIQSENNNQIKIDKPADSTGTTNLKAITDKYAKWSGSWIMGDTEGIGSSAIMNIKNVDKNQFEFSIKASFVTTVTNKDGQKFLNPHMGGIEGIAYLNSTKEAYYTLDDYPNYKMIFKMSGENTINIEEINTKTGQDYGNSPSAGVNVRYFGNYVLGKSYEQKTPINSQSIDTTRKEYTENLCAENENVLFSFKIANSSKILSICTSKNQPDYIIYRFGTKDKIELEFPENKDESWKQFSYSYYLRGGEKGNEGMDLNYLTFENTGYEYKIYQEYTAKDNVTKIGVKVTDKLTKKETDINGLSNSMNGTLISLRGNTKIKTSDSPPQKTSIKSDSEVSPIPVQKTVNFSTIDINEKYFNSANGFAELMLKLPQLDGNYDGIPEINKYFVGKEKFFYDELPLDMLEESNKKVEGKYDNWYRSADYRLEAVLGNIISISAELNGGAGGVGWAGIEGDTFNLNTGKKLSLEDIFKVNKDEYMNFIYDFVSKKIMSDINNNKQSGYGSGYNFDDAYSGDGYKSIRSFDPNDFYLSQNALVVFYPKYALTVGAGGPRKFEIPFESILNILAIDIKK